MNRKPLVIFGDGKQTRDFVYVEDAAQAIIAMAEDTSCINKELNFCSGVETSIQIIAELICDYFGLPTEEYIHYETARPGDVMRHLGSNEKFKQLLGFAPSVGIDDGIIKTCDWFKTLPFASEELLSLEVLRNWE
jgi:UDP-glucose 4-epimerase